MAEVTKEMLLGEVLKLQDTVSRCSEGVEDLLRAARETNAVMAEGRRRIDRTKAALGYAL